MERNDFILQRIRRVASADLQMGRPDLLPTPHTTSMNFQLIFMNYLQLPTHRVSDSMVSIGWVVSVVSGVSQLDYTVYLFAPGLYSQSSAILGKQELCRYHPAWHRSPLGDTTELLFTENH